MTKPIRLQLSRRRGYSLQAATIAANGLPAVNVSRPSIWGNPFTVAKLIEAGYACDDATARRHAVTCFQGWLAGSDKYWMGDTADARREQFRAKMHTLRGNNLACWCGLDQPCHADVLLELANKDRAP